MRVLFFLKRQKLAAVCLLPVLGKGLLTRKPTSKLDGSAAIGDPEKSFDLNLRMASITEKPEIQIKLVNY